MASKAWAIESVVSGRYDEDIVNALNYTSPAERYVKETETTAVLCSTVVFSRRLY